MTVASVAGNRSGATRWSESRPIVFIARAAEPMLPGCDVPTRTMRMDMLCYSSGPLAGAFLPLLPTCQRREAA